MILGLVQEVTDTGNFFVGEVDDVYGVAIDQIKITCWPLAKLTAVAVLR